MQRHGGNIFTHPVTLDVSANLNPLGCPERVTRAVMESAALWAHYPDPDCTVLCRAVAEDHGVSPQQVVCGNGADDLLFRTLAALRPKRVLLCAPGFGEYERAAVQCGAAVQYHMLEMVESFALTERILQDITPEISLVLLCSPNNPTGQLIGDALLARITERCAKTGSRLLLDTCFLPFTHAVLPPLLPHVLTLHAFTKTHCIPGLRIGYCLCGDGETARRIRETGQYWSVSAPAQAAGLACVEEKAHAGAARALFDVQRPRLAAALTQMGMQVFPSDAGFLLFKSPHPLYAPLLRQGILIRSCESFPGLGADFYRVCIRTAPENDRLIDAIGRCIT
ncbi:MAG: aminotransferase class I/II-fold pyridoxal phosphate-dependent enzyme [Oscillospiraceae bacterium]|nr:aminotransferase class I/II-fold pyridoxal phosphate-dependent enzyme [Oscillospiraceae bacterium]